MRNDTKHLLSSPVNAKRLREAIRQANEGLCVERELIEPRGVKPKI